MKVNIYLHNEIASTLKCFGRLDDVINKMLDDCVNNDIDIMDKPSCPSKDGCLHFVIDITNDNYLTLLEQFGSKNQRISIRRLIYWFVENEVYEDFGWTVVNKFVDRHRQQFENKLNTAITELMKAKLYAPQKSYDLDKIICNIKELL